MTWQQSDHALLPGHFILRFDAAKFKEQFVKWIEDEVQLGFVAIIDLANVAAKRNGQQHHDNIHDDNAKNFSVHN